MTSFYLSFKPDMPIPASGLYHYTDAGDGNYEERVISCNGQACDDPLQTVHVHAPESPPELLQWDEFLYIRPTDWLRVPSGPPAIYLALRPVAKGQPQFQWEGALQPDPGGDPSRLSLPQNVRIHLHIISDDRRDEGYKKALDAAQQGNVTGGLADNAELFWQALTDVCEDLTQHLQRSLGSTLSASGYDPGSLDRFSNPDWVFQLCRSLSEGFIEGHAQAPFAITTSGGHQVAPGSADSWVKVLGRAKQGETLDNNTLDGDEQQAMTMLADAVIEQFKLRNIMPKIDQVTVLGWILGCLTPGTTPSQEFAFWHLHFPHWHKDLVQALRMYGVRRDDKDWDTLTQIIMGNYPTQGTGLSVSDWLIGLTLKEAETVGIILPDWITFMIEAVWNDVQDKASAMT